MKITYTNPEERNLMTTNALQVQIQAAEQRIKDLPAWAERHAGKLKWAAFAAVCVLIAPIVLAGIGGLIGGIVFTAIGFTAMQLAPVFAKRIANMKKEMMLAEANRHLEALKAEARKNPIETMQNVWLEQGRKLKTESDKIGKFATKVNKYGQQRDDLKRKFPGETAIFDKVHSDMSLLLQKRREKWQDSKTKHELAAAEIEKCQAFWAMGLATADLRQSAEDVEVEFMQKIRKETAIDAVMDQLASSMADLDQLMMEEIDLYPIASKQSMLQNNPSPALDVQSRVINTVSVEATPRRDG